ncbi:GDSL-type esterase/lipase family protein [Massilia pseudoviolaceinigra]|uniref:GDSL-type esterase/lipase family protein n=1 Tax=Massilia pseudoviolaceinigra TaxID=3057165 RepID=UPI002796762B|nr:GDSL-type esterase/lipase family protein [Massilia sp. CCM 9206]MDQ1923031.1 putative glycoside hydrolase [Massilia sp. CCM 9206]
MMKRIAKPLRLSLVLPALLAVGACATAAKKSAELTIYSAGPRAGSHVFVADFEAMQRVDGASVLVPKPAVPKVAQSRVGVDVGDNAMTLHFKDAWYANLRVESDAPLDLHAYVPEGVVAFELNVEELAQGGVSFKVSCGKECERQVPYLVPARAMAGKGWQPLVFSMRCFARDGDDFRAVTVPFALEGSGSGRVGIAHIRFLKTGTPNAVCPDYKTQSVTPEMLNQSWSVNNWLPRHEAKKAEVERRNAAGEKTGIVFIGDSITEGWEKTGAPIWQRYYARYNALGLGFGGDHTENVLWRLQHGALEGLDPKVVVLMAGTNNTGDRRENPVTTAAGIRRNIEEVRQRLPNARILLLAIFPRDAKPDSQLRRINDEVNKILAGFDDGKRIFFLNINQTFLNADGTLSREVMPDLLHLNEQSYEAWAKAMAPALQRLMGE